MWLTSLAIRRPIFILMIMTTFFVLGIFSYSKMKVELQPNVDFPVITVVVNYPGAGPEEIETLISKKIEDAVGSASGVKTVDSVAREGVSITSITFFLGTNLDGAFTDVSSKVEAIRSSLPKDALSPSISKVDTRSQPILYLGLSSPRPSQELRDLADDQFKDKIGRVTGVASVTISGGDVREILVAIKPDSLAAYGMTPDDVYQQIQKSTLNLPAGRVTEGNREYQVRFYGEFQKVDQIKNLKINLKNHDSNNGPGAAVPLSSIADVTDTIADHTVVNRLNQQESINIVIQKSADANTVEVADGVKSAISLLQKSYPDVSFIYSLDQSRQVRDSLADLRVSLFLGIFLVVLIVFLFLHNLRGTFIVALAIPTSIFATFIVMYFSGFTINSMTMLALSMAVGILVDDAIVVLENIYRHLSLGEDPVQAAINGRSEIGTAAITITLIDVVVFLPIAFMGGIVGMFFKSFGITVASATLCSLFVSFTITPMLASRWYRKGEKFDEPKGFFLILETLYKKVERGYRNTLRRALNRRWLVLLLGFGLLLFVFNMVGGSFGKLAQVAAAFPKTALSSPFMIIAIILVVIGFFSRRKYFLRAAFGLACLSVVLAVAGVLGASFGKPLLNFRFAPEQDSGQVDIKVTMPAGVSLETTDRIVRQIESRIKNNKEVDNISTLVGGWTQAGFGGGGNSGSRYGEITIKLRDKLSFAERALPFLKHRDLRTRSDQEIAAEIRSSIGQYPGAFITANAISGFAGFGAPIQVALFGNDINALASDAEKTKTILASIKGVINPESSLTLAQPEYRFIIDRDRANDLDLTPQDIGTNVRIAFQGNTDVKYRVFGKEYDIRVRLGSSSENNTAQLLQIPIGYRNGSTIRLGDVASQELRNAPTKIERHDRNRQVIVSAYLLPNYSPGNMQIDIDKALTSAGIPSAGIEKSWQGENKTSAEEFPFMISALGLAFILVYILMASLFDNLLTPLVIMLSEPQALIGGLLALIITGAGLSIVAMIGVIMLVGLVGKNAILLVDYTNTLRGRGLPRNDAILEAAPTRLRPIMMTTLAMLFGMLPVALAIGRGSEFRAPLGITVMGGLILSSLLTLLVIPCTYTLFDDFSNWISKVIFRRQVVSLDAPTQEQETTAGRR